VSTRDIRQVGRLERWEAANRARTAYDVDLSSLSGMTRFYSGGCAAHASARDGAEALPPCLSCGVELRRHQRVGAAWLYLRERGLLADDVGLGKTAQVAAMLAMCAETGELSARSRAVIICQPAAVLQWEAELRRMTRGIAIGAASGSARQRTETYLAPWEVMVCSDRAFTPQRGQVRSREGDAGLLGQFPVSIVVYDDIDAMRHHRNRTASALVRFCEGRSRVYGVHGTPEQKRLAELHSFLVPAGGREVLGSLRQFKADFVTTGARYFFSPAMTCPAGHAWPQPARRCPECGAPGRPDPTGRKMRRSVATDTGVKNLPRLQFLLAPMVLRRRAADVDDASLPALSFHAVWLEPSAAQRARYARLRQGVVQRLRAGGEVSETEAAARWLHGWQICSGLATLDDGADDSVKLDWVMDHLDGGDLATEKVVVFINFRPNIEAFSARLARAGIGHVLMWGDEPGKAERFARQERFRADPACRVLAGTTTIERSLNLQAARHFIAVDTILNPARMRQLAGRIRRAGSAYQTVYFHQLLLRGTQEESYPALLGAEQAVTDAVWGDGPSEMFSMNLSPRRRLQLISGS
jgi:SNF2 family DNA or RNA helicase